MGCKGSSVRITPSRPKIPRKSSHLAVTGFFYICCFCSASEFCPTFCPTGKSCRFAGYFAVFLESSSPWVFQPFERVTRALSPKHANLFLQIQILFILHLKKDFQDAGSRNLVIFAESIQPLDRLVTQDEVVLLFPFSVLATDFLSPKPPDRRDAMGPLNGAPPKGVEGL